MSRNKELLNLIVLQLNNPKLAKQWHPTKNGKLTPYDVSIRVNKKVWWKCDKGDDHEWKTTVYHRIMVAHFAL